MSLDNEARGLAGDELPWPVLRAMVLLRDEFTCAICGGYATQVDHILARVHGGSDHPRNLQASCKPCNQSKGNWLPDERPQFFAHLTLDGVRDLLDELEQAHAVADVGARVMCDRIADLADGTVVPGEPLDLDRHGLCGTCSDPGRAYVMHVDSCPLEAAS